MKPSFVLGLDDKALENFDFDSFLQDPNETESAPVTAIMSPLDNPQQQQLVPPFGDMDGPDVSACFGFCVVQRADEMKPSFDLGNLGFDDEKALEQFDFDRFLRNPNDDKFSRLAESNFQGLDGIGGGF
jgi:hypothetical protein